MITVSARPAPGAPLRAVIGTVEIVSGALAAHRIAGGSTPGIPWIVGLTVMTWGLSLLAMRTRVSMPMLIGAMAVGQLGLHAFMSWMAPAAAHTGHMHGGAGAPVVDLSPHMLAAHLAVTLLTAAVWIVRRRVLVAITRLPHLIWTPSGPARIASPAARWIPSTSRWSLRPPGRAPPSLCAFA